jgi:hypothetical protein
MITIFENYKIDEFGNIYSKRGLLKLKNDKGYLRVNIKQKWVSYARIVGTYLCENENNYDRLIFIDKNPLNCKKENIKWVDEDEYQKYVYESQIKNKILEEQEAIAKCKCNIIKEYYKTKNIDIINDYFINISKQIKFDYWREIQGFVYIKIIEKLQRFSILYDLKIYIFSRLEFFKINHYQYLYNLPISENTQNKNN